MDKVGMILAIAVSAVITFLLRAFPFLDFKDGKTMPPKLVYLGKILPPAIMAVLIVYCLKDIVGNFETYAVPEIIAVMLVAISYKWKHNTLLSIVLGTVCNIILLRIM